MPVRQYAHRLSRFFAIATTVLIGLFAFERQGLEAKAPGVTHCYKGVCHRVRTLDETRMLLGSTLVVAASHYDFPWNDRFNIGAFTSNGERFDAGDRDRVSSSDFPDGTELLLRNPENGFVSHVRVNDFGPFHGDRRLDVTRRVADDLGFAKRGVTGLEVTVIAIPREDDLTYRRNRPRTRAMGPLGLYGEADMPALITHKLSARSPADAARIIITAPLDLRQLTAEPVGNAVIAVAEVADVANALTEVLRIEPTAGDNIAVDRVSTSAELPALPSSGEAVAAVSEGTMQDPVAPPHAGGIEQATTAAEPEAFTAIAGATELASSPLDSAAEAPAYAAPSITGPLVGGAHHALAFAVASAFASSAGDASARAAFVPPPMSTPALLLVLMMVLTMGIIAASWNVGVTPADAHRIAVSPTPIARVAANTADTAWLSPQPAPGLVTRALGITARARTALVRKAPATAAPREAEVTIATPQAPVLPMVTGTSLISADMRIDGTLRTTGRIVIAGHVEGSIQAEGIEILAGGHVRGIVVADEITIDGDVEGSISARLVRIGPNARITSDITCEMITMDERANVEATFRRPPAKA